MCTVCMYNLTSVHGDRVCAQTIYYIKYLAGRHCVVVNIAGLDSFFAAATKVA